MKRRSGASHSAVQSYMTTTFGTVYPIVSATDIAAIEAQDRACTLWCDERAEPRYVPTHSLTAHHFAAVSTDELRAVLLAEEQEHPSIETPSGVFVARTHFATSTIDDAVRQQGNSYKVLTVHDKRRCALESARCRVALDGYSPEQILVIDCSHWDRRDMNRRRGRGPIGEKIYLENFDCGDGVLRTIFGAMNMGGMVMEAVDVIDGAVDRQVYLHWARTKLAPVLNRYDRHNPLPNSVVLMDNGRLPPPPARAPAPRR